MFAKFWSLHRDQHDNKPLTVVYANTSNEFASMPKHVQFFCNYIEQKYDIKIDLHIVRSKITFFDVVRTEGYPVASKKVARMIRDIKADLKANNIAYSEIEPFLDKGIESTQYLRSLHLRNGVILYLTGYTSKDTVCNACKMHNKLRKLIYATFDII